MIFRAVDCPHCGNATTVSSEYETSKCKWCRCLMSVKFKGAGKKAKVEVEAIDFPEDEIQNEFEEQKN